MTVGGRRDVTVRKMGVSILYSNATLLGATEGAPLDSNLSEDTES